MTRLATLKPTEAQIQVSILECLAWRGAVAVRVNSGVFKSLDGKRVAKGAPAGTCDIIALFQGKYLAIEVKRPGGRLRDVQDTFLERVEVAGGMVVVAYSVDDVQRALDDIEAQQR